MCTALTLNNKGCYSLFGRNMDIEYTFNQAVHFVPRKFKYIDIATKKEASLKYAVMGMATSIEKHPMFADGFNEKGLAMAGLNFPGYAEYEDEIVEGKVNVSPSDLMLWTLGNFETIEEVKEAFKNVNIVKKQLNEYTPLAPLHWIVADKSGNSIVIEKVKGQLNVYDNPVGVLTNSPEFSWHITNLRQYMSLKATQPTDTEWSDLRLRPLGQGLGTIGIPGDFTPASRFVRTSFLKANMPQVESESLALGEFFHILNNVKMVRGSVVTPEGKNDITQYTACMSLNEGVYYYNTYNNNRINATNMMSEDLDGSEIKVYPYLDTIDINKQN